MRRIVQRPALLQHHVRNGAIGEAGVEMRQVVIVGDAPGERTLAGCGGAVNCDGEVHAGASIMKSRREQPGTAEQYVASRRGGAADNHHFARLP